MADAQHVISIILRAKSEVDAAFNAAEGRLTGLQAKVDEAGRRVQSVGAVMFGAGGAMAAGLGSVASLGASFETSMNVFEATAGATADQMARAGQLAIELGADLSLPATSAADAGNAMTALVQNGLSVENTFGAVRGTLELSAAAHLEEARAAEITANALNAFKLSGDQATRVADLLAAGSNSAGLQIEQLADGLQMSSAVFAAAGMPIESLITLLGEMGRAGIKGSDAGTSLKQMLLTLEAPTAKAEAMLQQLGISIYDSAGQMLPARAIIGQFSSALGGLTQQQRDMALGTIFGSDAIRAANVVLMGGVGAYDQMQAAVTRSGAAADMAAARMKGLGGAFEGLKSQIETVLLGSIQSAMPALEGLVRRVADVVAAIGVWSNAHPGLLANIAMTVTAVLLLGGAFLLVTGTMIRFVGSFIGIAQGIASAVSAIAGFVAAANPVVLVIVAIIAAGVVLYNAWRGNWFGMRDVVDQVVTGIGARLTQFLDWINGLLVKVGLAPIAWRQALADIKGTAGSMGQAVTGGLGGLFTGAKESVLGALGLTGGGLGLSGLGATGAVLPESVLPGNGESPIAPAILDTGTKLSDLASAAQSALGSIANMAQSAVQASIALGKIPGGMGMGPGENGPYEDVYRLQDVFQNLGAKDRPEVAPHWENGKLVGGQGPVETNRWATTLTDQFGNHLNDIAAKMGMSIQAYAGLVVGKFQAGLVRDPEVMRWTNVDKWRSLVMQQNEATMQQNELAGIVGGTPEMMRSMLGAQGYQVTGAQAGVLADAAREGTLSQLAKDAAQFTPAIRDNATTVATAIGTNTEKLIGEIRAAFNKVAPANLPPGATNVPGAPTWASLMGLPEPNMSVGQPANALGALPTLGGLPLTMFAPAAYTPPAANGPYGAMPGTYLPGNAFSYLGAASPNGPATPTGYNVLGGGLAMVDLRDLRNLAPVQGTGTMSRTTSEGDLRNIRNLAPNQQTTTISVSVGSGAVQVHGDNEAGDGQALGQGIASFVKAFFGAAKRAQPGPIGLPGNP